MQYRREIDGLRAIAVLPVILFHAGFSWFSGGYVGVDVFFVISGYLITSILLSDLDNGNFSIVKFYERRARRILPALFFVMLCCIPFAWMWLAPQEFKNFSQALVAISFFSSNILFWRKSGYFAPASEENPLLHTWSLAVEEQFYIIFPVMLLLLWKFGKRPIFYAIVFLSLTSLVLAEYGWRHHPSANFYLLPTRAWELGVGAICAFLLYRRPAQKNTFASLFGLGLIGYSVVFFDETTPFPSLYALVPVMGTALVIIYADKTPAARMMSNRLFVGIGLISFSAYLWHQPLLAFARVRSPVEPNPLLMIGLSFLSLILAALTWRYVEQPFRTRSHPLTKTRKKIFSYSALGTVLFVGAGLYGQLQDGFSSRSTPSGKTFADLNIEERTRVNHGLNVQCDGEFTTSEHCRTGENPTVLVWGDSFAMHLMQAVRASESLGDRNIIQFTKSLCAPVFGLAIVERKPESWAKGCIEFNNQVRDWLSNNVTVEYVLLSSRMDIIHSDTLNEDGETNQPSTKLVLAAANEVADFLEGLGKKAVFISPPPMTGEDLSKCSSYNLVFGTNEDFSCSFHLDTTSKEYSKIVAFLEAPDYRFPVVDLRKYICREAVCETFISGVNIYRDAGHLSLIGSRYIGTRYDLLGDAMKVAGQAEM